MIIILRIGLFFCLFLLNSCYLSLPHRQQTQNIMPAPCVGPSVSQSLEYQYFTKGDWPDAAWWEAFNAPDLNTLIAEALCCNPTLAEFEAKVAFARQEAIIARSKLMPYIFFDIVDTWEHLSKNGIYRALNPNIPLNVNVTEINYNFSYEFDFWGKNANLFKAAMGESYAREAESAQVVLTTTTALATAYFALKTHLMQRELYRELFYLRKSFADLSDLMLKKALYSTLPPLFAEEKVLEAEQFLAEIESEIAADTHLINILAGKSPDAPLCLAPILPPLPGPFELPCNLSSDLLARRPDLMAQIWRAKSLAYQTGAAMAACYPDINLMGFVGLESVSLHRLFQGGSATWGVQPALHLPIFTAGAIMANVRAKKAEFDEAIFAYNALLLQSAQEVTDLLAVATAIFQKKSEQEEIVEIAKKREAIVSLRKTSGLDSLFADYTLQEEVILKQIEDVSLLFGKYQAVVKLIKSLGGGYAAPCVPLHAECI